MKKKILIVEDEKQQMDLLTRKFEAHDFEVAQANTSHKAFEALPTFKPDLILLDVLLPGHDGYHFLDEIQMSEYAEIPVVIFTNLDSDLDKRRALEKYQVADFMTKADTPLSELLLRVGNFLDD